MSLLTRHSQALHAEERDELEVLRATVAQMSAMCLCAASGNYERRADFVVGSNRYPDALALRENLNSLLDRNDAFAREVMGMLKDMSERRLYRVVLLESLDGLYLRAAMAINEARLAMIEDERLRGAAHDERRRLADRLEDTVLSVAEQVAAASTQLAATASTLSVSAVGAVDEAGTASATVERLDEASREIEQVVGLIASIAAQTKLLALNATIEAARAGDAGRGFAVVASEVKSLADTTAKSTETITAQVQTMLAVTTQSRAAMHSVELTVRDMSPMVDDLLVAVDGHAPHAGQPSQGQGLAQMAEVLRAEVGDFLAVMRAG